MFTFVYNVFHCSNTTSENILHSGYNSTFVEPSALRQQYDCVEFITIEAVLTSELLTISSGRNDQSNINARSHGSDNGLPVTFDEIQHRLTLPKLIY